MLVIAGAVAAACGGSNGGDTTDASAFCTDDDQCPAGMVCQGGFCTVPTDAGPPVDAPPGSADILVTPNILDFGSPLLGIDSVQQIEIGNIGESDLHVTGITVFENDALSEYQASPSGAVNLVIAPGASIMVAVTLRQQDAEIDVGEVRIASDDPDEPLSVVSLLSDLKGTPDIDATPTLVAYGTVSFGTTNTADVDVTNKGSGNAPLVINTISITNTSGMGAVYSTTIFSITPGGTEVPATLPVYLSAGDMLVPADTLRIRVAFDATTSPGPAPAENLRILSNDLDESQVNLPISATVIGCMTPMPEICNGLDDDCDLTSDEGDPGSGGGCTTGLGGVCNPGVQHCISGGIMCVPNIAPGSVPETCNNADDDCDGSTDEGLTQMCSTACGVGVEFCASGGWVGCNAPPVLAETCNNLDDDCDGSIDEGDPGGGVGCATGLPGVCSLGVSHCLGGAVQCVPNIAPGTQAEICNGIDDNCNGMTDEMNPNTTCPGQLPGAGNVSTWLCSSGSCLVNTCASGYSDPYTTPGDGCECATDTYSTTCASAPFSSVPVGGTVVFAGSITTAAGSDYVGVTFTVPGVGSPYHPKIELTGGGAEYAIDVMSDCATAGSCSTTGGAPNETGTNVNAWELNYNAYTPGAGCCADNTPRVASMYIRIYRRFGDAPTCNAYQVTASNL